MKGADAIRAAAVELGIRVEPVSPELPRGKARTEVRRQLPPGALRDLMAKTGATDKTILRALGCDPVRRHGRLPAHESHQSTKLIETARVVSWLSELARTPGMPPEISDALETAARGLDRGDCAAGRNPYDGAETKRR